MKIGQNRDYLLQTLDKKKKVYKTADVSKLPDKGARLKKDIENLEATLNKLQLVEETCLRGSPQNLEKSLEDTKTLVTNTSPKPSEKKFPFSGVLSSLETFEGLKCKNEKEQSKFSKETFTENRTILISPQQHANSSFEKYRSNSSNIPSSHHFLTSSTEVKKKIDDAMILVQKSVRSLPRETELEDNPLALHTLLLPHQQHALAWLLGRECQFPYGGILADDMGLGKSLTMISLILKHKENLQRKLKSSEIKSGGKIIQEPGSTLIICPASLIHHWKKEILNHCNEGSLSAYVYHGAKRIRNPNELCKYDVVITTYETVRADVEPDLKQAEGKLKPSEKTKPNNPLLSLLWERIILDEAHKIKNPASLVTKCIYLLTAKYRWAVSGTPIHNNLMDLYSLIKFLNFSPFDDPMLWKKHIMKMKNVLKPLMKSILLRRTKDQTDEKGKCLVQLPPKEMQIVTLKLTKTEKDIYDKLYSFYSSRMKTLFEPKDNSNCSSSSEDGKRKSNERNAKNAASSLLVMLLRLQQCCCHLTLLQQVVEDDISLCQDSEEIDLAQALGSLSLNSSNNSTSSISSVGDSTNASLPNSPSIVKDDGLNFDVLGLSSYVDSNHLKAKSNSTKVSSIIEELVRIRNNADNGRMEKCVLVSQWVSLLKVMAVHIESKGFHFGMISGDVKAEKRMSIVDDFNRPNGIEILLLSLKAGGVGLNLIGGNHMFLLDIHWNPALENQACDRIYRLGQTKKVFIHKFVCLDTIEENIMKLQEEKLSLARSVLEDGNAKQRYTLKDLQKLLK